MNVSKITMNKIVKTISTTMVICAMVVSAFNGPVIAVANAQTTSGFGFSLPDFNFPDLNLGSGGNTQTTSQSVTSITMQSCDLDVNSTRVNSGGFIKFLIFVSEGSSIFTALVFPTIRK